jgi:hypothetical protein
VFIVDEYGIVGREHETCDNCGVMTAFNPRTPIKELRVWPGKQLGDFLWEDTGVRGASALEGKVMAGERLAGIVRDAGLTGVQFYRCGTECMLREDEEWEEGWEFEVETWRNKTAEQLEKLGERANGIPDFDQSYYVIGVQGNRARLGKDSVMFRPERPEECWNLREWEYCPACNCLIQEQPDSPQKRETMRMSGKTLKRVMMWRNRGARFKKMYFHLSDWNGCDFFKIDQYMGVTERVVRLLEEEEVTNWFAGEAIGI